MVGERSIMNGHGTFATARVCLAERAGGIYSTIWVRGACAGDASQRGP